MILEGIVTTTNLDDSTNISPMGPHVDAEMKRFILRPYLETTTYANLRRNGNGVFHVVDDVNLIARAAIGELDPLPRLVPCRAVAGSRLADTCRWYAFRIESVENTSPRAQMRAEVIDSGWVRDFFGFNRAKHAVLEAAILATRIHITPYHEILAEMDRFARLVEKTGGKQEKAAYAILVRYVHEYPSVKESMND
ncbi:MAG: DUF447 family protein [Pirellulales bacterium]|nr:DUF447 family protein [Pirellulales bacterium]